MCNGQVYGGSEPLRIVKEIVKDANGFYPECIYKMEVDLMNRSLVMESNDERIMLDSNIGDLNFSSIVMFGYYPSVEITIPYNVSR